MPKKRARPTAAAIHGVLRELSGLDEFPPGHQEIVESILNGRDTIGIMPAGGRKSLGYELPAMLLPGTTLVVTERPPEQRAAGPREILVVTPEQLMSKEFRDPLREIALALVVIDATGLPPSEQAFRSTILDIREATSSSARPPILALTEAAPPQGVRDVTTALGLTEPHVVDARVYRPNLHFEVVHTSNEPQKRRHLVRLLQEIDGAGIVYASNVRQVDLLHTLLSGLGFKVAKFHGRISTKQRREHQSRFVADRFHAMIATGSFGVDLDKSNVRFVVHYSVPGTLEAYYQEAGRAGRDGRAARCVLFHQIAEPGTQPYFLGGRYPRFEDVHALYDALIRLHGSDPVTLTELRAATRNAEESNVRAILALLKDLRVVCEHRGSKLEVLRTDLGFDALQEIAARHKNEHAADRGKLEHMIDFCQTERCRWKVLVEYFEEDVPWQQCGTCDNCLRPVEQHVRPPAERTEAADRVPPARNQ